MKPEISVSNANSRYTHINLLMFFDNRFFKQALACLSSILDHTKADVNLYIDYSSGLFDENVGVLCSFNARLHVVPIAVKESLGAGCFAFSDRWPPIVVKRVFAPFTIEGRERIIYMDADMIANCDLLELMNLDLRGMSIGAHGKRSFNSGIIVYDLKTLKGRHSIEEIQSLIQNAKRQYVYPDQDLLNEQFADDHFDIGGDYNYRAWNTFVWRNPLRHHAKVIHYLGKIKPDSHKWIEWKANKPFWKYALPYYGRKYRLKVGVRSFFWYPVALLRRFIYHTGRKD